MNRDWSYSHWELINGYLWLGLSINTLNIILRLRSQSHSSYHKYHAAVGLGLRQLNNATSALEGACVYYYYYFHCYLIMDRFIHKLRAYNYHSVLQQWPAFTIKKLEFVKLLPAITIRLLLWKAQQIIFMLESQEFQIYDSIHFDKVCCIRFWREEITLISANYIYWYVTVEKQFWFRCYDSCWFQFDGFDWSKTTSVHRVNNKQFRTNNWLWSRFDINWKMEAQ